VSPSSAGSAGPAQLDLAAGRPDLEPELRRCRGAAGRLQAIHRSRLPPEEDVIEAIEALQSRSETSLDQPLGEEGDTALGDLLPAPEPVDEPEDLLLLLLLPGLVAALPELERRVMLLRYFQELSQDEIAARVGYSQMHVSRLLRRAIERLRGQMLLG